MSEPAVWDVGFVVADRYKLEALLGQGGMGSVWRAQHLLLRSPVALKMINPSIANTREAVARFLREAQAAAALRSPHVVQILDYGVHQEVPFIAMELMEGESLADRLHRLGKLSPADTARILTQVSRAISRAHEAGVIHRDLKPDNIFLVRNEDEEVAKVLDFGIAKTTEGVAPRTAATVTGAMLGTPYYMSPEQADGGRGVDLRTDLWALAVIAFECITGNRPFDAGTIGELVLQICVRPIQVPSTVTRVPPGFDAWFARGTDRRLDGRFQSARELAEELRRVCGVTQVPSVSSVEQDAIGTAATVTAVTARSNDFAATTGGRSSMGATIAGAPSRTGRKLVIGSTLGGLALAIVGVAVWMSRSSVDPSPPTASAGAPTPSLAAEPTPAAPDVPPPAAEPKATEAARAEPTPAVEPQVPEAARATSPAPPAAPSVPVKPAPASVRSPKKPASRPPSAPASEPAKPAAPAGPAKVDLGI
jgi:serine/threonine-protein kinase